MRSHGSRQARKWAIIIGIVTAILVADGILTLYIAYALPACSLEAEPLLRQLNLCR